MPREALFVRSIVFVGLPEFIEKLGGNPEALFLKAGLNPPHIQKGITFASWPKACKLLELAADELNEPQFGIKWALEISDDFENTGPMVFLASLIPDVRTFLDMAIQYQKVHTNGFIWDYVDSPETGLATYLIHLHPMTPPCRQYVEHIMAVTVRMAGRFYKDVRFSNVCFQHSTPADTFWHKKALQCPVSFNNAELSITVDRAYLDKKMGGSLKVLQPMLKMYLDKQMRKSPRSDTPISDSIMEILPSILGTMKSNPGAVAQTLNISVKKMQRLLKEEGTHFSDIRDQVRREITNRLLFESNLTITHLATLLDYSSSEAFNTACKRWFGVSPRKH